MKNNKNIKLKLSQTGANNTLFNNERKSNWLNVLTIVS